VKRKKGKRKRKYRGGGGGVSYGLGNRVGSENSNGSKQYKLVAMRADVASEGWKGK